MDNGANNKIRVLVVDDSALMSRQIAGILSDDDKIVVVGRAKDGREALDMVAGLKPDVVTMDVEMPRMNGITALKHIMVRHSVPTVMISALTTEGARTTFDALKYGAIDVIAKPSRREDESLDAQKADIISKVRRAAAIRTGRSRYIRMGQSPKESEKSSGGPCDHSTRFIGIGAGTGGYYGLLRIVPALTGEFRDVMIVVLLVARRYVAPFVSYLESHSRVPVKTVDGVEVPEKGTCYICSGQDGATLFKGSHGSAVFQLRGSQMTSPFPVNEMLSSLSAFGSRSVGVVMTGAGTDGADGVAAIRKAGGMGVVQDITNCLDPQMPLAALQKDSVEKILPDFLMAEFFMKLHSADELN
ncbi:MAG: chemotaxis protein CheB [Desulfomonilaceae bacterium]|nr:chemotaxis protein CheB [Desulfomonilaceae bacterium]